MAFRFRVPKSSFIGENSLVAAEKDICLMGKKAFIVTGKSMISQGHVTKLSHLLERNNIQYVIFSEVCGEPNDEMIGYGVDNLKESNCDFIIGFGGGSIIDTAKMVSIASTIGLDVLKSGNNEISSPHPPLIAIPSTAGSGAEATPYAVIINSKKQRKVLFSGNSLFADMVIIDPLYSAQIPQEVTVSSGLDALTHAIESFCSKKASCESDLFALSAIERIFHSLPKAISNGGDLQAREQMAIAAFEAGISVANSSVTLVHGMSRPIGALFHIPHGLSNAMLLPECLAFVADYIYDRLSILAYKIGVASSTSNNETNACNFINSLNELYAICHVPTLKEYGIDKTIYMNFLEKMTEDALASGSCANTVKLISKDDIKNIYIELWKNE